jgi:hypothetical protein
LVEPVTSPNQRSLFETLAELHKLSKVVSHPIRRLDRLAFKARALIGLLILALLPFPLGVDFYGIMYMSGISLRGRDEDRWKRRRLRRFVMNLVKMGLLHAEKIIYYDDKLVHGTELRPYADLSARGIVCPVGVRRVSSKPRGRSPKTYQLKLSASGTRRSQEANLEFSTIRRPDPSFLKRAAKEIHTVHGFARTLIEENGIDDQVETLVALDMVRMQLRKHTERVAYLLGIFENTRAIVMRLVAILPLFEPVKDSTCSRRPSAELVRPSDSNIE